jgi:hypothetical protein
MLPRGLGSAVSGCAPSSPTAELDPVALRQHLGVGRLYRRTGNPEQAQEHLSIATTMYREMGMTYWLKEAETESRQ